MTYEVKRRRGGRPGNRNVGNNSFQDSFINGGSEIIQISRTSQVVDGDDRLIILRERLLSLAKKYPVHARSISQMASCVDLITHLPVVQCL
jgi:hypothetical protein